jgi:hypothetical protein
MYEIVEITEKERVSTIENMDPSNLPTEPSA